MTDAERLDALLNLVDSERTPDPDATARLIVLGLAERHGKGVRPTNAGWVVLGDRGRPFQN
ncbi:MULTISPECIES: hypothetical protein [Brevundimonas]|uniref:hypothetical protein n=1 Tax=Brevundimonas TaxID=41275 RepID=UPI0034D3D213